MNASTLLLQRELQKLKKKPCSNFFQIYGLNDDNLHEWIIFVIGPPHTLYEGGVYRATMRFPDTYPMEPPSVQFTCEMYHPNIYSDGKVCITTLQVPSGDSSDAALYWRPVLGVEQAILSVVSLLSDPNCDDPANSAAANMLRKEPKKFKKLVKEKAKLSLKSVPDDFIAPVVAGTGSLDRVELQRSISGLSSRNLKSGANGLGYDGEIEEETEYDYDYSDDEEWGNEPWEEENDDNESDNIIKEEELKKKKKSEKSSSSSKRRGSKSSKSSASSASDGSSKSRRDSKSSKPSRDSKRSSKRRSMRSKSDVTTSASGDDKLGAKSKSHSASVSHK